MHLALSLSQQSGIKSLNSDCFSLYSTYSLVDSPCVEDGSKYQQNNLVEWYKLPSLEG